MIDVWSKAQVARVMRSVANGGAMYFRKTNEVMFVAEKPFLCPESVLASSDRMYPRERERLEKTNSMTADQKSNIVQILLQLFPRNNLRSIQ